MEVTDGGRRARSSPYLVKEAADWPAGQRGGGGRQGREPRGRRRPPPPPPAPRDPAAQRQAPPRQWGWGCVWGTPPPPPRSGGRRGRVRCGARCPAGEQGSDRPSGKQHRKPGTRGRGGARLQVELGPRAGRRGRGSTAFCAVIFLFCNWAVRGLAQGHLGAVLWEAQGRPHPAGVPGEGTLRPGQPLAGASREALGRRERVCTCCPAQEPCVLPVLGTET